MTVPIYEYKCSACEAAFEQLVRSQRDEKKVVCPKCGDRRIERQLSVPAAPHTNTKTPPAGPCGSCSDGSCPYA